MISKAAIEKPVLGNLPQRLPREFADARLAAPAKPSFHKDGKQISRFRSADNCFDVLLRFLRQSDVSAQSARR